MKSFSSSLINRLMALCTYSIGVVGHHEARAWCFLLPEAITYGSSKKALNAGEAIGIAAKPELNHLRDGRIVMANIHSVESFDLVFTLANGTEKVISVPKGAAVGLTRDNHYFMIQTNLIPNGVRLSLESDVWAMGNWPYYYNDVQKESRNISNADGKSSLVEGGWLRVIPIRYAAFTSPPTDVNIRSISRLGVIYATSQDLPNAASEAPFSSPIFSDLEAILELINDDPDLIVPVDGDPINQHSISLTWTIKSVAP